MRFLSAHIVTCITYYHFQLPFDTMAILYYFMMDAMQSRFKTIWFGFQLFHSMYCEQLVSYVFECDPVFYGEYDQM